MTAPNAGKTAGVLRLRMHREGVPCRASLGFVNGLPEALPGTGEMLTPEEQAALMRCRMEARRRSYLAGRLAAKLAAADYLGLPEQSGHAVEIASGVFRQPLVRCAFPNPPAITLSHTEGLAVAIAHDPGHIMGVDVERLDRASAALNGFFTVPEQHLAWEFPFGAGPSQVLLWTMKEALSKAIRCGLTAPAAVLEIGAAQTAGDGSLHASFSNFGQYKCLGWMRGAYAVSIVLPRKTELDFDCRELPV